MSFHRLLGPIASAEMSATGDFVPPFPLPLLGHFSSSPGLSSSLAMRQGILLSQLTGMHVASCTCDLSLAIRLRKFSASSKFSFPHPSPPKTPSTRLNSPLILHISGVVFCVFLLSASAWVSSTNWLSQNLILSSVL